MIKKLSTIEQGYSFEIWSKSVQIFIFWYQTICFQKIWLETRILAKRLSKLDQNWHSYDHFKVRRSKKLCTIGRGYFVFEIWNALWQRDYQNRTKVDTVMTILKFGDPKSSAQSSEVTFLKLDQNWPKFCFLFDTKRYVS